MSAPEFATLTTDDLVTGEAVALDLPPASLGSRIVSGLIDVVVTMILFVARSSSSWWPRCRPTAR